MIDTKALRRLAQAALAGPDGISLSWIKLLQDFQQEASPAVVIELLDRMEKMEAALRDHHKNAMCEGCDHSHPLTQLRLSAYQQSKLYADTVSVLEKLGEGRLLGGGILAGTPASLERWVRTSCVRIGTSQD